MTKEIRTINEYTRFRFNKKETVRGHFKFVNTKTLSLKDHERIKGGNAKALVLNKEFLLGDFDKDGLLNIDDKLPFKKSNETVEETKLSDSLFKVDKEFMNNQNKTNKILKDFRKIVAELKGQSINETRNSIDGRAKSPISLLNKSVNIGIVELTDKIGARYIGKNYDDLSQVRGEVLKHYTLIEQRDYYHDLRPDGYKGIHLIVKDRKNNVFEIQLNSERIRRISEFNHELYKTGASQFTRLIKLAERADNGEPYALKTYNKLTDKKIKELLLNK